MSELIIYPKSRIENLNAVEKAQYIPVLIASAAEGIFNSLNDDLRKKYSIDDITALLEKSDKDKNGIITCDEAENDIDNIFGLRTCENNDELDKIQTFVNKAVEDLSSIKGFQKGITLNRVLWPTAKPIMVSYTDFKEIFQKPVAAKYYSDNIGKNTEYNKRLVELFKAKNKKVAEDLASGKISKEEAAQLTVTEADIKNMGFSDKVLQDILRYYKGN